MFKITYKIRPYYTDRYSLMCNSIEQALQLANDFLGCNYEIISIRKV